MLELLIQMPQKTKTSGAAINEPDQNATRRGIEAPQSSNHFK